MRPLDAGDAQFVAKRRVMAASAKGVTRGVEDRGQFDTLMASVQARIVGAGDLGSCDHYVRG